MLIPKKKVIERAKENGSIDRVDRLLSASHLHKVKRECPSLIGWDESVICLRHRIYFGRALPNWGVVVRHQDICQGAATLSTRESHPFRGESMSIISVYLDMVSETQDILRDNGMFMGDIKEKYGTLQKAFDVYFYEFTKLINNDKRKKDYREDYDEFNASFRKWAKL